MRNILILESLASNNLGGAERSMFSYIQHLSSKNVNIFLGYEKEGNLLDGKNKQYFKDILKSEFSSFTRQGLIAFVKNLKILVRFIEKNEIDLIFTHTIHGFLFLKLIKMFTSIEIVVYFKWIFTKPSIGILNKWGLDGIDKAVCLPSVKPYWQSNGLKECIITELYNAIELPKKTLYNESVEVKKLVFFGRIIPSKGIELVLDALSQETNFEFYIYGIFDPVVNEYHKELLEKVFAYKLSNKVFFKGFCNQPVKEIVKYDVAIVPSIFFEAQGRVIFEAMATKTLVITTKIGGMPDVLGELSSALCFEPSALDLKNKLTELKQFNRDQIVKFKNALNQRFKNCFTINKTFEGLDKVLGV